MEVDEIVVYPNFASDLSAGRRVDICRQLLQRAIRNASTS